MKRLHQQGFKLADKLGAAFVHTHWLRFFVCALASTGRLALTAAPYPGGSQCVVCHDGIEWIREPDTGMMKKTMEVGQKRGDPAGCVVCHGGDPKAMTAEAAHAGPNVYPDPGSPWINDQTCGQCHKRHVKTQWTSLMMTEAGKIQGTTWAFGGLEGGYAHKWRNYDVHKSHEHRRADWNGAIPRLHGHVAAEGAASFSGFSEPTSPRTDGFGTLKNSS